MDYKRLQMYVHHLRSVHHIQFVTINTHKKKRKKHLMEFVAHTFRILQTKAAAYVILITLSNCQN